MKQPEVVTMFNNQFDKDHHQGMWDDANGTKKPLYMRMRFAQKMREQELEQERAKEKYCPHCHLLIPKSGICDMCD